MTCGQVRSSNNVPRADEENEIIIIDGSSASPSQNPDHGNGFDPPPKPGDPTLYDFVDPPSAIYYNVDNGEYFFFFFCRRESRIWTKTLKSSQTLGSHNPNFYPQMPHSQTLFGCK